VVVRSPGLSNEFPFDVMAVVLHNPSPSKIFPITHSFLADVEGDTAFNQTREQGPSDTSFWKAQVDRVEKLRFDSTKSKIVEFSIRNRHRGAAPNEIVVILRNPLF
jgi:hypothetical protein